MTNYYHNFVLVIFGAFMKKVLPIIILVLCLISACLLAGCKVTEEIKVVSVSAISDTFKTVYEVGDELDLEGSKIRVQMSDGVILSVPVTESMIDASSFSTTSPANRKTLKIIYQNFVCTVAYKVIDKKPDVSIKRSYLENMPTEFFKGDALPTNKNGFIENALLCLDLGDDNIVKVPVKGIWVNGFSTTRSGDQSCTVDYESDYGDVSVVWAYTVKDLASVKSVSASSVPSVYQNATEQDFRTALQGTVFTVTYSDSTYQDYEYNANFKITDFKSENSGKNSCSLSFTDNQGRTVKFSVDYTVKQVYPVYLVTFDLNYPDSNNFTVATVDGKISTPSVERDGYEILGWYVWNGSALSSDPFDFNSIIDENTTLRPRWRRLTYTIKIYSFGVLISEDTYNVDSERPLDPPVSVEGYTFSHYVNEQNQKITSIKKGMTGNLVLTAVWIADGYSIEYDLNDADSGFKATNPNPDAYTKEDPLVLQPATRNGYVFEGWFLNGTPISSTEGYQKNIRLTARWSVAEYTLTLVNGLTEESIKTVKFKITDSNTKIDKYSNDNFYFYGWFFDSEYEREFNYDSNHNYYLPSGTWGDFSLYAKVERKYTLIMDGNNNSSLSYVYFTDKEEYVNIPVPYKFGSDFVAWLGQNDFSTLKYSATDGVISAETSVIKDIMKERDTQSARFVATYNYHNNNITYHVYTDYSGEEIKKQDSYYTNISKELLLPERNGYTFVGWYENQNYSSTPISSISAFSKDGDLNLYAKWTAIVYKITVDKGLADSNISFIPSTYTADDEFSLPIPSCKNYSFGGWFLDTDYEISQSITIQKGTYGDLNLHAKWTPTSIYMDLKNMIGATYDGESRYNVESGVVTLANANKIGYVFDGWFEDSAYKKQVTEFTASEYGVDNPFGAYAKWTAVSYKVTYILNDNTLCPATNSNPVTATIEDVIDLENPTRIGYYFDGWYNNSSYSGSNVTTLKNTINDITLYARWRERTYNITYSNCDFEGVNIANLKTTFKVSSSGTTLGNVTRTHYVFDGWTLNGEIVKKIGMPSNPETCDDLTLVALWSPKQYTLSLSANGNRATIYYDIEQFVDGFYTLPTLDSLLGTSFDESVLKGKSFDGWYKGSDTIKIITSISIGELNNISLNALTSYVTYTINYHLPENAVNNQNNPSEFTLKTTTATIYSPTKENKAFKGWFLDQDYNTSAGTLTNGTIKITLTANNLDLYACFVDIYSIEYNLTEGVTISSQPKTYNETVSVTIANPTTSMNFGGWWWIEAKKIVTSTGDFGSSGNVTLLPLVYDRTATQKLLFKINADDTATLVGIGGNATTLKIPQTVSGKTVKNIDDTAFSGNAYIQTATIPNNIQSIGYRAFASCTKLATLVIEGGSNISNQAFSDCSALKTVTISPSATVGDAVFERCVSITTMTVGANKTLISYFGKSAYTNCTSRGGFYVPNSLTTVRITGDTASLNGVFTACGFLTSVYIDIDTFVSFTQSDVNALSQNDISVFVKDSLKEQYQTTYTNINFVSM